MKRVPKFNSGDKVDLEYNSIGDIHNVGIIQSSFYDQGVLFYKIDWVEINDKSFTVEFFKDQYKFCYEEELMAI